MGDGLRRILRYGVRAVLIMFATLYFLIDLFFLSVLRPLRRRLMALRLVQRLREWVGTWNWYASLTLFIVPWLLLEPIKPMAFFLFAHRHHAAGTLLMTGGEIIKLTLLEQLFDMTKPQLLTFPWFAWGYGHWRAVLSYLRSLPVWLRVPAEVSIDPGVADAAAQAGALTSRGSHPLEDRRDPLDCMRNGRLV